MCSATQAVKCGVASSSPSSLASVSLSFQSQLYNFTFPLCRPDSPCCDTVPVHPTLSRSHFSQMFFTAFSRHFRCGIYSFPKTLHASQSARDAARARAREPCVQKHQPRHRAVCHPTYLLFQKQVFTKEQSARSMASSSASATSCSSARLMNDCTARGSSPRSGPAR